VAFTRYEQLIRNR